MPHLSQTDLLLLARIEESPCYGYELYGEGRGSRSSLYHSLRKLERLRLLSFSTQTGVMAPDRRVYKLSPTGRRFLQSGSSEYRQHLLEKARKLISSYQRIQRSLEVLMLPDASGTPFRIR